MANNAAKWYIYGVELDNPQFLSHYAGPFDRPDQALVVELELRAQNPDPNRWYLMVAHPPIPEPGVIHQILMDTPKEETKVNELKPFITSYKKP